MAGALRENSQVLFTASPPEEGPWKAAAGGGTAISRRFSLAQKTAYLRRREAGLSGSSAGASPIFASTLWASVVLFCLRHASAQSR